MKHTYKPIAHVEFEEMVSLIEQGNDEHHDEVVNGDSEKVIEEVDFLSSSRVLELPKPRKFRKFKGYSPKQNQNVS